MRYLDRITPHFPIRTELGASAVPLTYTLHGGGLDHVRHLLVNGVEVPFRPGSGEWLEFDPTVYLPPTGQDAITVVAVFSETDQLAISVPSEPWLYLEQVEPPQVPLGGGAFRLHGSGLDHAMTVRIGDSYNPATIVGRAPHVLDVHYDSLVNHIPPGATTTIYVWSGAHLPEGCQPQQASVEVRVSHGEEILRHLPHGRPGHPSHPARDHAHGSATH
jgi:hypothetical protein